MSSGRLSHLGTPRPFSGVVFDGLSDAHLCPPRGFPAARMWFPPPGGQIFGLARGPAGKPWGLARCTAGKPWGKFSISQNRGGQRCASDSPSKTTPENGLGMPRCESGPDNKNSYPGQCTPSTGLTGGRPELESPLRPLLDFGNQAKCWCANERGSKMHQNPRISSKSINF